MFSHLFKATSKFLNLDHMIDSADADQAKRLVPFFYYFMTYIALANLEGLNYIISHVNLGQLSPRWPLFWSQGLDFGSTVTIVFVFFVLSSLAAALFYKNLAFRALAFLGMLQFHAYQSSLNGPNHQWDVWLWVSLIVVFLPNIWKAGAKLDTKRKFLIIFWGAQAFILLTYSMSGLGKVLGSFEQFSQGQVTSFSPEAAAIHIATLLNSMHETTPLGPLIVTNPMLGWPPFLGVLYVELFSIWAAFRPSLHKPWAAALILFHIGTFLTMRAVFITPAALLLVLFFNSPFQKNFDWRSTVKDLPIFGYLWTYLESR